MRRVRGSGDSQGVECKCEGRACSAGAEEACKWPGEPRACTRGADVRGAIRCDAQCAEWPGRGRAPGVLCAGRACASAARVCRRAGCAEPEVRGAERGPCVRPCAVRWGRPGAYSPRLPHRLRLQLWLRVPGRSPAARTHRRQAWRSPATPPLQCRPAPASEERGAGRGLGGAGEADWSCAAVRARSQEPAARSLALARPPAPSLI